MYNSIDEKKDSRNIPFSKDAIKSRYLSTDKKKYYLAGIDQNYQQLREVQLNELTRILTALKSEYDGLIRMTIIKKKETEKLGQQIKMLEKMNQRIQNKNNEKFEENINVESIIEIKRLKKEEENFQKITMIHLMEKMREEVYQIKMEITGLETDTKKFQKFYEKERIQENVIMDKLNYYTSKVNLALNKNSIDTSNNNLILKYYNNVIDQKWSFINSADERKEKQIKIASEAKNDSQDQEEVEKRKVLSLCLLYNKYLRKKMEKELKENSTLEETFQTIKDITGSSNLKMIVDKIMSKDKTYNMHVSRVIDKENKIEIIKKDIKSLEENYKKFRNDLDDNLQESIFTTQNVKKPQIHLEEDEEALLEEEKLLQEELKLIQDKHKDVRLIYEKVTENIKTICKFDAKKEETSNASININNSSDFYNNDLDNSLNLNRNGNNDDELSRAFKEHLEVSKKSFQTNILNFGKNDFIKMLKERGDKTEVVSNPIKNKRDKIKINNKKSNVEKYSNNKDGNNLQQGSSMQVAGYNEYVYSDEEIIEDDKKIKEEYDQIVNSYKRKEKQRLLELAKPDKEKKN